jgi:hypothetical protein
MISKKNNLNWLQLHEWVGCNNCVHADKKMIGLGNACPKNLTNIGPCSLECRSFEAEDREKYMKKILYKFEKSFNMFLRG